MSALTISPLEYFPLRVSDNKRHLVKKDGSPFVYLGDTAWELFHRLTREEADYYLQTRAGQKFTVIQAVVVAEQLGLSVRSAMGHLPFVDKDPTKPVERYFQDVDWMIQRANELGLVVGLLPTWGDKVTRGWGNTEDPIFNPENARVYGEFLGKRYKDKAIIWVIGGDRKVADEHAYATWRSMVAGIKAGDGGRHLMTFHPHWQQPSFESWPNEPWLDFHACQSAHVQRDMPNYETITKGRSIEPTKPIFDSEPCYEDHPIRGNPENGWFDCYDTRKAAYRALFAGAFGHTYGCHGVWQMYQEGRPPAGTVRTPWKSAIHLHGARQMQWVRELIESRAFYKAVPDQSILVDEGIVADHARAIRAEDHSFAFVYIPRAKPRELNLKVLKGKSYKTSWFDPRRGTWKLNETYSSSDKCLVTPPTNELCEDWVLVLDRVN